MQGWVFDIESDALYLKSTKIWYIKFKSLDGKRSLSLHPYNEDGCKEKIEEWINSFPDGSLVVFHNGLSFDAWMLWKFFGIQPVVGKKGKDYLGGKHVQFVDTFVLSQYLYPDLPSHSLEYLARGSDSEKMDYRGALVRDGAMIGNEPKGFEFSFYHKLMDVYCDDDVDADIGVFNRLWEKATERYGEGNWIHPSFRQMQKDFFLYSAQAYSGVKFDVEKARALLGKINEMMAEIKAYVDPRLPKRALKTAEAKEYTIPAKPYKKDGSLSAVMERWLSKHNAIIKDGMIEAHNVKCEFKAGNVLPITPPMEIEDSNELKQYFLDNGWVPHEDFYNYKRDPVTNKPMRDDKGKLIKTTPKIQNAGKLCPNLLKLESEIPAKVVKFLSLRNRKGVVEGWLSNWRMEFDGRLSAEISGYAPSSRVKHRTVVNCPKASKEVLLGAEMRELFTVEEGNVYVGTDAAALENRTLASYTCKYDGGKFAEMLLEQDIHCFNSFVFYPELESRFSMDQEGLKDDPDFKPYRAKAKTGSYLLAFGGGAAKLASSLGLSPARGKEAYENYWKMNEGLGKLKEAAERYYDTKGQKKYIVGKDGRIVSVRSKNVILSCLGQGLGAIAMSYAACLMDTWLGDMYLDELHRPYYLYKGKMVRRISMVHDEYSWEVEPDIAEEIRAMSMKAIIRAGELLKMEIPLDAEGKIGLNWKDVH